MELREKKRSMRVVYEIYEGEILISTSRVIAENYKILGFAVVPKGTILKKSWEDLGDLVDYIEENKSGRFIKAE